MDPETIRAARDARDRYLMGVDPHVVADFRRQWEQSLGARHPCLPDDDQLGEMRVRIQNEIGEYRRRFNARPDYLIGGRDLRASLRRCEQAGHANAIMRGPNLAVFGVPVLLTENGDPGLLFCAGPAGTTLGMGWAAYSGEPRGSVVEKPPVSPAPVEPQGIPQQRLRLRP